MKKIELTNLKKSHNCKFGQIPENFTPNITEDCIFLENGVPIGFYCRDIGEYSEMAKKILLFCDNELRTSRVPKMNMTRSATLNNFDAGKDDACIQFSVILGSIPPKTRMRRPFPNISSVHRKKSAKPFVRQMLNLCNYVEGIIKEIIPNVYEKQIEVFRNVEDKWKFGNIFTSSITNCNIAATYHIDNLNMKDCVNAIIFTKKNAEGGNTTLPDYGATVDSSHCGMLVYPAWKSMHGVTEIIKKTKDGYRNSFVFYPLNYFLKKRNGI